MSADREKLRRDLETDYTLLGQAFDERIAQLSHRAASEEIPADAALELAHGLRDTMKMVAMLASRVREQHGLIDQQTNSLGKMAAIIEALAGTAARPAE
jgi:hypothetical protein